MDDAKVRIFPTEFSERDLIDWFELPADSLLLSLELDPNSRMVTVVVRTEDDSVRHFEVASGGYHEHLNKHVSVDAAGVRTVTWQ